MKERLLHLLACPTCGGDILLAYASKYDGREIIEGVLTCKKCAREYRVVRGVPRFVDLRKIEEDKLETAENFGWQWTNFTQEDPKYADQFLGWLQPVGPDFFARKVVLDGVESAFALTRNLPNVHIVQCDIYKLPFKKAFDYAFSVGVLHHTPDPKKAFTSLSAKVKKGGYVSAWVYGAENNEWISKYVNPVRESFTSQISQPLLYQISKLPTLGVFLTTKLVYRPINAAAKPVADKLFYNEYLNHLGTFGWREQHNIVFDHLVAPTAFYISKEDFARWWDETGAEDVEITWHNRNSWCGFGRV